MKVDSPDLALLDWVLKNQEVLVAAAQQIVHVIFCGHTRTAGCVEKSQFATRMITNIIDQLRIGESVRPVVERNSSPGTDPKRPRGRPRKQGVRPQPKEDGINGHRTRSTTTGVSGVSGLLAGPAFTSSPVKSGEKVGQIRPYSH